MKEAKRPPRSWEIQKKSKKMNHWEKRRQDEP